MKQLSTKKYIISTIAIIFIILFVFFLSLKNKSSVETIISSEKETISEPKVEEILKNQESRDKTKEAVKKNLEEVNRPTFKLIAGDFELSVEFDSNKTLYQIFELEKEKGLLEFSGEEYTGLGFFVKEIGTLKENKNGSLMYFINGKEASVGVSSYIPKDGDIITWEIR